MSDTEEPAGEERPEETPPARSVDENLKSKATWLRLLFMVILCILGWVAGIVGSVVVVLGFLWVLFTGETNRQLVQTGQSLAIYFYEIVRYLTFNTEQKPFPLGGDWPSAESGAADL